MKKAALIAAALAVVLTLAACGNRDNSDSSNQPNNSSQTENGGVNSSHEDGNGSVTGSNTAGNGTTTGNGSATGSGSITDDSNTAGSGTGSMSRSQAGDDLRRAADDVGDAVTGLVDEGRNAVARGTSTTSFQRMLDNARVHDVDGVLTDGENSRW